MIPNRLNRTQFIRHYFTASFICLIFGLQTLIASCGGNSNPDKRNAKVQTEEQHSAPEQKKTENLHLERHTLERHTEEIQDSDEEKKTKKTADDTSPEIPTPNSPSPLWVPGYAEASHVGPQFTNRESWPVIVVLHGNFDRPEWQCDMWKEVGAWYGWILCPRGVRTSAATLAEDRWTYKGGAKSVSKEIHAALNALENKYPGAVRRDGMVLVGFSLGGILAPQIVHQNKNMFHSVFFIEGGLKQLEQYLPVLKRYGVSSIGLAMSLPKNRQNAILLKKKILRGGYKFEYVDMRGAGHNYRADFSRTGKIALKEILNTEVKDGP